MYEGPPPPDTLQEGIRLFNEDFFFEAHEVWEDLWHRERGGSRLFLQGLIQVAAALHHFREGNMGGAASLVEKALTKLRQYPDEYLGINSNRLIAYLERFKHSLRRDVPQKQGGGIPPFPKLGVPGGAERGASEEEP